MSRLIDQSDLLAPVSVHAVMPGARASTPILIDRKLERI